MKSNIAALDASTSSTKTAATAVKRIKFSKNAFNLVGKFVSAAKQYPDSSECKILVEFGNLEKTAINEEAADYVVRDTENSHCLRLYPKYTEAAKTLWKDLETERPLHPEDFIELRTNESHYISVPAALAASLSPGDIVQLYDVLFTVHVQREQYRNINRLSDLSEGQKEWKGKKMVKKVEGTDVEVEVDIKPKNPKFKFKARFGAKLPTVSVASLEKVYKEQQMVTYHIENPRTHILARAGRSGYDGGDDEVFRMRKEWFQPNDVVRIYYDAQYDGSVPSEPIVGPDGRVYSFEVVPYPNEYISENDFKSDEVKFDCAKSRTEVDKKEMAWCFMIRISQRVVGKASDPEAYAATDGYDTDHPIEDSRFSVKINLYKEVIHRDFGILSHPLWFRFISCYHNYFRGIFQCLINWKKTENRMDRLLNFAGAAAEVDEGGETARPFDFTIDYTCKSILFSMRDMIQRFGVPIDKKTAKELLDKLTEVRRKPSSTEMRGSVSDVSELATKAKHSVVCLNEIRSMEAAKSYLSEGFNRAYAILLPEPSNLGVDMFNVLASITDKAAGTALLRALHFGESISKSKFGDEVAQVGSSLKMTGYSSKALHPLIFAVGDIDASAYDQEASTLSKFLGISSEMAPHLAGWLRGEEAVAGDSREHEEDEEEPVKTEKHVVFTDEQQQEILEMGTQNALMDAIQYDVSDIDMPEDDYGDGYDDSHADESSSSSRSSGSSRSSKRKPTSSTRSKTKPSTRKSASKRPRTSRRAV
jgi:hypothetical protein